MDRLLTIWSTANKDSNLLTTATIGTLANHQETKAATTVELLKETADQMEAILPLMGMEDGLDGYLEDKEGVNHREAQEVLEPQEDLEALEVADIPEAAEAEVVAAGATVAPASIHKVPQERRSSTSLTSSHTLS